MKITFTISGQDDVRRAFRLLESKAPKAMGAALWKEGNAIMNKAKLLTPVDTGALKNSGIVELPVITGEEIVVTMGFGGAAVDYAETQHEEASYYHKPPTQYKFLEQPFREAQDGMDARIAQELWSRLR